MNWIDKVLEETDHVETPKSFVRWSLLSAISAVTAPHVSLNRQGAYHLYPNVYVMLLAESGVGKGFGVWLAKSLVKAVDSTRVFSGRNSIQKIVTDLSMAYTRKGKEMIKDSRAFISSGEFINLLIKDEQAISILVEWYDTHYVREWPNSLKSTGTEILKHLNITLLGATNADYLRESVPLAAIRGGFFGRVCWIYAQEKGKVNALIDEPEENRQVSQGKIDEWSTYLKELAKIPHGSEFRVSDQARDFFRPWYYNLQERIRAGHLVDKTGYVHRLQDHALKTAMLLSLSESSELVLRRRHVEEGIALAECVMPVLKKATIGVGLSQFAPKNEAFLRTLFKSPEGMVLRQRMLQLNHSEFDSSELDHITLTLEDAGFIRQIKEGKKVAYQITPRGREEFLTIQKKLKRRQDASKDNLKD